MNSKIAKPNVGKGALTFISDTFDHDEYAKVASAVRLVELGLVDQSFKVNLVEFWKAEEEELKHGFLGKPLTKRFNSEMGDLIGGYGWQAEIKRGRKKPLKLTAEYFLMYVGLEDLDEDYAYLYFDKVARFTTYPYFRALFATSASNAGLALAPLPSLIERVD